MTEMSWMTCTCEAITPLPWRPRASHTPLKQHFTPPLTRRSAPYSSEESAKAKTQKEVMKALRELKLHLPPQKGQGSRSSTLSTLKYALRCVKQVEGRVMSPLYSGLRCLMRRRVAPSAPARGNFLLEAALTGPSSCPSS